MRQPESGEGVYRCSKCGKRIHFPVIDKKGKLVQANSILNPYPCPSCRNRHWKRDGSVRY